MGCDELNTVDDVLVNYVNEGYNVYQVRYDPNNFQQSALGNLLPIGGVDGGRDITSGRSTSGIVRGAVRWLINSIIPIVSEEVQREMNSAGSTTSTVKDRYM